MSEICEHPFCTRFISTKCSNHCELDLCQEHLIEHKNLFLIQYEKSVNNLKKSINEFLDSIEQTKNDINMKYEKEILSINKIHNKKFDLNEEKSLFIISTENLIQKKLQLLNDVKNNQALLYQYDIEQIKIYLTKIREYINEEKNDENDKKSFSSLSDSNDDDDDDDEFKLKNKTKLDDIHHIDDFSPIKL